VRNPWQIITTTPLLLARESVAVGQRRS
jgi:hypothetical protein